jgi:hypothetical protein
MRKSSDAEQVRVGLSGLLGGPSAFSPDRLSGAGEAAATWIGEALGETIERLRQMAALRATLSGKRLRVAD